MGDNSVSDLILSAERMAAIRSRLHPSDQSRCAEPLDIDEARDLLAAYEQLHAAQKRLIDKWRKEAIAKHYSEMKNRVYTKCAEELSELAGNGSKHV